MKIYKLKTLLESNVSNMFIFGSSILLPNGAFAHRYIIILSF